jgi:hypothetical protein
MSPKTLKTAFFSLFICFMAIFPLSADDLTPLSVTPTPSPARSPLPTLSPTPSIQSLDNAGADLLKDRAWLTDLYSWNETFDLDHQSVEANKTGAYCIGNGRAFALVGLSSPLWTWSNLYGASYQEPDLGDMRMNITRAGLEVWCPKQQIGWVRRSGVVRVHAEGNGLTVESYDFAPVAPSEDNAWDNTAVLVRMVHVINTGNQPETDLDIELKIQPAWNVQPKNKIEGKDLVIDQKASRHVKNRTVWRLGAFNDKNVRIWDDNLHYSVPTLQPGEETWAAFFLLSANSTQENSSQAQDLKKKGPLSLLDQTRSYYQNWFEKGTTFSGDSKIADLFDIESMIFKSQQSYSGGFSPLIGYSYTWIRDNNGPIRWFLKTGHPQEAKRAMDFFYGVACSMGSLPNSIRVDYPLNYHLKDLSNIHVEHAETPNWIVLQHWWYYLTTGDIELIRARWNYLKRCVFGQVNQDDKYFFHRDETYLWCLESRCFDFVPFPNYDLSTYAFSLDSSFDVVSAAEHLAYMGKYLEMDKDVSSLKKLAERVRDKAEETFWNDKNGYWAPAQSLLGPLYNAPFANILLNPFWCGYARNDLDPIPETPLSSKRAVEAIRNAYPWLGRDDGFWKTTPTVDFFVGMNPGQLLYDMCKARLSWADWAYRAVLRTATPSGEFAEMYDGDYHPWNPPAWGVGTSGRVRPWEGGLNTESVLEYLTGFAPDAGNGRVVFAPHLPDDLKELEAHNLWVGPTRLSISLKRLNPKQWTFTLHLDRGEQLEVAVDFWASLRSLASVDPSDEVIWDKDLKDTNGLEGLCHITLEADKDFSFTVTEGSKLPDEQSTPPKPQAFQPEPYEVPGGELLLLTTPSGVLNKHKHTQPDDFVAVGKSELKLMEKVTRPVGFLDMDLPISTEDIVHALLDDKGAPKYRLAVFGRGVFSSGKHHFKPVVYWANPKVGQAVKKFLEGGGCLFLGPSYPNREVLPDWMINLTGGGWEEGTLEDKVVVAEPAKMQANQKYLDQVSVDNPGSEADHAVTFTGETFEDTQNLPDSQDEKKMIQDQGRGFTGYYQFTVKTVPGFKHRLWIRVNTGHNIKGMALQVQDGDQWKQVGIRTQSDGTTRRFLALYFDIPEKAVISDKTVFRLVSRTEDEVNVYHLWIYKLEGGASQSLAQILGFAADQQVGEVSHGLLPQGSQWKSPLLLSQHPEQAAILVQKVGKGYLIRSELTLEDSLGLLKSLLRPETLEALEDSWPGS